MINRFSLKGLHNDEFLSYFKILFTLLVKYNLVALKLDAQTNVVKEKIEPIELVFATPQASSITEELQDLDHRRDEAVVGIYLLAKAHLHHFSADIRAAAKAIIDLFEKYGHHIEHQNYLAETETIESLSKDFEIDQKIVSYVSLLTLNAWVTELKSANTAFKTKYADRNNAEAKQPAEKIVALRKPATVEMNKLNSLIDGLDIVDSLGVKTGDYTDLINNINELNKQYQDMINIRIGKREAKKKKDIDGNHPTNNNG